MDPASRVASKLRARGIDDACLDRAQALVPIALVAFDQPDIAYVWFISPNVTLGGSVPIDLISRGDLDAAKVRRVLTAICQAR